MQRGVASKMSTAYLRRAFYSLWMAGWPSAAGWLSGAAMGSGVAMDKVHAICALMMLLALLAGAGMAPRAAGDGAYFCGMVRVHFVVYGHRTGRRSPRQSRGGRRATGGGVAS